MTASTSNRLYRQILRLYPEPFRLEFGSEILNVFAECSATQNVWPLLVDGLRTAVRQQWRYLTATAPERTALYSEVAMSPRLARTMAMMALVVALSTALFGHSEKPKPQPCITIGVEAHIVYWSAFTASAHGKHTTLAPHNDQ